MKRSALFAALGICLFTSFALAQSRSGIIDSRDASRIGLQIDWTTSIEVDPAHGEIAGMFLHVSDAISTTTFEIEYGGSVEVAELAKLVKGSDPEKQKVALERLASISPKHFANLAADGFDEAFAAYSKSAKKPAIVREVISQYDRNPIGRVYGIEGAEVAANDRVYILNAGRGVIAKVTKYVTPRMVLYVSTTEGLVQALDASSGKKLWSTMIGDRRFNTKAPTANDDFVCVTNGSSVHCLRTDTGKFIWSQPCQAAPAKPCAVSKDFVFVPLVTGTVEAFPLFEQTSEKDKKVANQFAAPKETKRKEQIEYEQAIRDLRLARYGKIERRVPKHLSVKGFVGAGAVSGRPIVTAITTSWPTNRGYYHIGDNSRDNLGKMRYRLETDGPISSSAAFLDHHFYVSSTDGSVYKIDERDGSIAWNIGVGEPISQTPIPVGGALYAISDDFGLFKIDMTYGNLDRNWPDRIGEIKSYIGASRDKLYLLNALDQIVVIQQKTGTLLATINTNGQDLRMYNLKTDRLFLGKKSGTIQCLRETSAVHPYIHSNATEQMAKTPETNPNQPAQGGGGEVNPFGGDKKEEKGEVNPFGAGKKEEKKKEANPFGG